MKPVDQTLFDVGNCLSACIATITGIPIGEIPHFCAEHENWYPRFAEWMQDRGFAPLSLAFDADTLADHLEWARKCGCQAAWIAGGSTERGRHFVVYLGDQLFHDPNPNYGRSGLTTIQDATFLLRVAG